MEKKMLFLTIFGMLALSLIFGCSQQSSLTATPVASGIKLAWAPMGGAAGYNIYRSAESGSLGTKANPSLVTGETTYTDSRVVDGVTYYYTVKAVDGGGNEAGSTPQASATAKTAPPKNLQIIINKGAQYAPSTSVSLTLSAFDASECRYSNDGATWSDWSAYATSMQWQLSSGDGAKDVYYQCKDEFGNMASPVSSSIYLDTIPPEITLKSPVAGGTYPGGFDVVFTVTDSKADTLNCNGWLDDGQSQVGVVDSGEEYNISAQTKAGSHTLRISCDDGINNVTKTVSFNVVDRPALSISLGDGSGYTATRTISVRVNAPLASQCQFSNDGITWNSWAPYSQNVQWTLTGGDGTKYVYAQCKGATGSASDVVSQSIELDSSPPPYISVMINNAASWTNSRNVNLRLYGFGADKCRLSNDGNYWSSWENYASTRGWTLTDGEGTKYVYYNCKNSLGNDIGTASATIRYTYQNPNPPQSMSISINDGASYTSSTLVHLTLYARGANQCRYQQENYGWGAWRDYTDYDSFKLSGGDGSKTIYYQCSNDYGTNTVHGTIYLRTSPPPPISDLTAHVQTTYPPVVYLRWSRPASGISLYRIYRSTSGMGLISLIGSTSSTTYTDINVMEGEGYSYTVKSVDSAGQESAASNVATVEVPGPVGPLLG